MPTKRLLDWNERLQALVQERTKAPFVWGQHDCSLWAADCILALTGEDLACSYRGKYTSAKSALRLIKASGPFRQPVDIFDFVLGERRHRAMAKLGDIVALEGSDVVPGMGMAMGLCYGAHSLFVGSSAGGDGLVRVDTLEVTHCYWV